MKLSLNWIGLFTDVASPLSRMTARELAHVYSIHTAEIEAVEIHAPIDGVVIGKVLSAVRHPDSTKLWICEVDVG